MRVKFMMMVITMVMVIMAGITVKEVILMQRLWW